MEGDTGQVARAEGQLFYDAFNASPIGIALEDMEGRPLFVNPALSSLLGYSEEEMQGKHCIEFSPREDAQKDWSLFELLRKGMIDHYQMEKRFFRRDGSSMWGRLHISLLDHRPSPLVIALVEDITDKRSIQETLESATKQTMAVTRCSRDFRYVWANQGCAELLQRPLDQIIGHPIAEVLGNEAFESLRHHFERVLAGENVAYEEEVNYGPIGRRWISAAYTPTLNASGVVDGWVAVLLDVTESKRVEHALRESNKRFRLLANIAPVMIWMSGIDKLFTYFNQRWLDFTGRPLKAELGNGWAEGVHPEDLERCLDTYTKAFDQHGSFQMEYRLRRHDGEYRWILDSGAPRSDAEGSFAGYIGSAIDVTEHKSAQDRLKEYERAVEGVEEMIAVVDRKYQYVIANDKFLKMRNMTKGQVVEHFAHEVLNEGVFDTVVKEKLDECFQGKVVRYEMKYTYPAFGERDILVSYFPIEGPAGVDRAACIVQDITERKLMEQALRSMNQKLIEAHEEERTRIARELHDDIGQRLALLMWKLGRLGSDVQNLPPESRKAVVEAREDVSQLVRDIQAMSHRLHSSKLEYFGLVRAAVIYCSELSDQHKVEIDVRSENVLDDLPQEIALCIFRVLQEALQNAIKHSRSQRFDVSFSRTQVEICLTVYDSGIGFDPLEAIKGRGVGLVSMKERLNLVGGKLSIESQPGKGTTIRAYVPLIPRTKTARAE